MIDNDIFPVIIDEGLLLDPITGVGDNLLSILATANNLARDMLRDFAQSPDFAAKMELAFGQGINVSPLQSAWMAGNFSMLPQIEVRSRSEINGANGAYAAALDTIFISKEFLEQNAGNLDAIASVILEENGHAVDARLNELDSLGDEGATFSALVRGENLTSQQLMALRTEDDTATVTLDGQVVEIEQNSDPSLVKDVYPGSSEGLRSTIFGENINDTLYFAGNDGVNGWGLWKSDGTTQGTTRIYSDVDNNFNLFLQYPGVRTKYATNFNGTLFFVARDNIHGQELWKSDGTAEGTALVKDINPGIGYGNGDPRSPTEFNGTVYFSANDGIHGWELWKSDGTEAGTVLVKDIYPGSNNGHPYDLTEFNGHLYFDGNDGTGFKLWRTDGTAEGTVPFADLYQIPEMVESNGNLYFRAVDGLGVDGTSMYGYELWKTDGTLGGTVLVKDINPGTNGTDLAYLTDVNGTLFFGANDEVHGYELWKTDGTEEGTVLVKDINPGSNSSSPRLIAAINDTLLFSADDGIHGWELWKSDGTEAGTVLVKDINPTGNSSIYPGIDGKAIVKVDDTLFFQINDGTHGAELWQTDGTAEGTVMVQDLNPGSNSSYAHPITVMDNTLLFMGNDGVHGQELWGLSTGAVNNPPVANNDEVTTNEDTVLSDNVFADHGNGPDYDPDGDPLTVTKVNDSSLNAGTQISLASGALLTFYTNGNFDYDPNGQFESLAVGTTATDSFTYTIDDGKDGTSTATVTVTITGVNDINNSPVAENDIVTANKNIILSGSVLTNNGNGTDYDPDGDVLTVTKVNDSIFNVGTKITLNSGALLTVNADGTFDYDPNGQFEFLAVGEMAVDNFTYTISDGNGGEDTATVTVNVARTLEPYLVKDINPGSPGSGNTKITDVNGTLYFWADDGTYGYELWKSNGTEVGTVLVKDINPGSDWSFVLVGESTNVNDTLFFAADDGTHGDELWKSNGTEVGTVLVKDIYDGIGSSEPGFYGGMVNVNGILFFDAIDGFEDIEGTDVKRTHGYELWKSDGSPDGTELIKDINTLPFFCTSATSCSTENSYPAGLTDVNSTLFFTANDVTHGWELWKSDGSPDGTELIKDINPGSESSLQNYTQFTNVNSTLFFTANDVTHGWELWKSDGSPDGTELIKDINPGSESGLTVYNPTNVNGTLFFIANDGVHGRELWKSNGTEEGTVLVKDINLGNGHSSLYNLTDVNGTLFFTVDDGKHGRELWKSDGTEAGTVLVKDINPGSGAAVSPFTLTSRMLTAHCFS